MVTTQVYAGLPGETEVQTNAAPTEYYHRINHLHQLDEFATQLISDPGNPIQASEVVVIFDLDGTLTVQPNPTNPNEKVVLNTDGKSVTAKFNENGFHTYVSSAWNVFDEITKRVHLGGLSEIFGIYADTQVETKSFFIQTQDEKGAVLQSIRKGRVISVQDSKIAPKYYRQKALAPYVALSPKEIENIKRVIFIDDSMGNIEYFRNDVRRFSLYQGAHVEIHYFEFHPL
jgi:hypothetical protein